MKIKTIETYGVSGDEKVNEFIKGKEVIDIKINTTYFPENIYADGRECDGYIHYTYTIVYKE